MKIATNVHTYTHVVVGIHLRYIVVACVCRVREPCF